MKFTPHETRQAQLASAELLLHTLEATKAYPVEFVIFKITGYHPKTVAPDLLTGLALQHDLGLLIEQISQTLSLHTQTTPEPVLSIDDVAGQFNVTSKTIQRWRRRGLPARRFIYPDGKCRVGFLLSSIERFIACRRDEVVHDGDFSGVSKSQFKQILHHARRLAVQCGCWESEVARRIARRVDCSPLTVLHTLRKHDQDHPNKAILPLASAALSDEQRRSILQLRRQGASLQSLASQFRLPRWAVYRVLLEEKIHRLGRRKVRFIDDPLYHQPQAESAIDAILSQGSLAGAPAAGELRVPHGLPPYLQELYRIPLLSPAEEQGLFLKYNFCKFQFHCARRRLDVEFARDHDLQSLETLWNRAVEVKNRIVQANLRLVVSVARQHWRPGLDLMELVSDGNLTLMRAAESFDIHKGNRFSTYATLSLMKGFARSISIMLSRRKGLVRDPALITAIPDPRAPLATARLADREQIHRLLEGLSDRERRVLVAHYDLDASGSQGGILSLSPHRTRQIQRLALAKLRHTSGVGESLAPVPGRKTR